MSETTERRAKKLLSALIQRTHSGHPCYGQYVVSVIGCPRVPKPGSEHGRRLLDLACQYLSITGNAEIQIPESLLRDPHGEIVIQKAKRRCGSKIVLELHPAAT